MPCCHGDYLPSYKNCPVKVRMAGKGTQIHASVRPEWKPQFLWFIMTRFVEWRKGTKALGHPTMQKFCVTTTSFALRKYSCLTKKQNPANSRKEGYLMLPDINCLDKQRARAGRHYEWTVYYKDLVFR